MLSLNNICHIKALLVGIGPLKQVNEFQLPKMLSKFKTNT